MSTPPGKVFLIGAGPGDPGLLTLAGRDRLAEAEVVLYDYLVNPRILEHAARDAELVCLGRHGEGRILSQEEIHRRMIAAATSGRIVARLKGGDASIFARAAEETAALAAAGVSYEIVPGVTAMQAASSYAGVPLTHRDHASCVALVTGQQGANSPGGPLDWAALARFPGTLAVYMGVTSAPDWTAALIAGGKSPQTPVAAVRHASLPTQQTWRTTLAQLPELLREQSIRPPVTTLVGESVAAAATLDWFTARPLFGQTVLVTRPVGQSEVMSDELARCGANVLQQPAIEITPANDDRLDRAIDRLDSFDWIVFSSANGVRYFVARLEHAGRDLRALGGVRIASIGPATSDTLWEYRLRADAEPTEYRAEALAERLAGDAAGKRFLLVRASRGRKVLAEILRAAGGEVTQAIAYESRDVVQPDPEIAAKLAAGEIDWVTATSSAIARSLVGLFGEDLRNTRLAAISSLTAGVLAEAGYPAAAVADEYTAEGVIATIVAAAAR